MRVPMLLVWVALALGAPIEGAPFRTWQDIRFAAVTRQVEDYSCGAASIVTMLRASFADDRSEQALLKGYLERQTPAKAEDPPYVTVLVASIQPENAGGER